jgi:hypothetical protein
MKENPNLEQLLEDKALRAAVHLSLSLKFSSDTG